MKKILIILSLFFLLSSCSKYITMNVYEKMYVSIDDATRDVYSQIKYYNVDSIPINKWITNIVTADTSQIEQKIIRKQLSNTSNYTFVLSTFKYPSTTYYYFLVRYNGKK